jgi:hypothetical protein
MLHTAIRSLAPVALIAAHLMLAPAAFAQDAPPADLPPEPGRYGVGFQSSWPAWGLSGTYEVNERITAQAVLGLLGTLNSISARGLYRFQKNENYDLYGFGTVGMWSYTVGTRENSLGVGGGAGVELNWQRILGADRGDFPPIFSTVDLGLVLATFEHYNFRGLQIGTGIHYRF